MHNSIPNTKLLISALIMMLSIMSFTSASPVHLSQRGAPGRANPAQKPQGQAYSPPAQVPYKQSPQQEDSPSEQATQPAQVNSPPGQPTHRSPPTQVNSPSEQATQPAFVNSPPAQPTQVSPPTQVNSPPIQIILPPSQPPQGNGMQHPGQDGRVTLETLSSQLDRMALQLSILGPMARQILIQRKQVTAILSQMNLKPPQPPISQPQQTGQPQDPENDN